MGDKLKTTGKRVRRREVRGKIRGTGFDKRKRNRKIDREKGEKREQSGRRRVRWVLLKRARS